MDQNGWSEPDGSKVAQTTGAIFVISDGGENFGSPSDQDFVNHDFGCDISSPSADASCTAPLKYYVIFDYGQHLDAEKMVTGLEAANSKG